MRFNAILVVDLETSSASPSRCEIVQIGALALNPATLNPYPGAEFESLMRPLEPDKVEAEALRVNKKVLEDLLVAPHPSEVWPKFAEWVSQFNFKGKNDAYTNPIAAGHNILNFDLPIINRYALKYGTTRTKKNGEVEQNIFCNFFQYDTLQMLNSWTESMTQPAKLSLDYLRKYFKIPAGDRATHDALQDVRDTAAILVKILGLQRKTATRVIWKDCFDPEAVRIEMEKRAAKRAKDRERAAKTKTWGGG